MGYRGSAEGLLDPATNLTYAVRYLAGAYRAAGGNESRAAALYTQGYLWGGKEARVFAIRFRPIVDNGDALTGRSCDV